VACLPFSDFAFVMAVRSQLTSDFLYALLLTVAGRRAAGTCAGQPEGGGHQSRPLRTHIEPLHRRLRQSLRNGSGSCKTGQAPR